MPVDTSKVRTVAIVGHAGSGKTSLLDAVLFIAKAVPVHGRPGNGTSRVDFLPDELDRKITIHAKPFHCQWDSYQLHFIDTPGASDFQGKRKRRCARRTRRSSSLMA